MFEGIQCSKVKKKKGKNACLLLRKKKKQKKTQPNTEDIWKGKGKEKRENAY